MYFLTKRGEGGILKFSLSRIAVEKPHKKLTRNTAHNQKNENRYFKIILYINVVI
jgi:hypothetical protein